jgi:hypothetical protein
MKESVVKMGEEGITVLKVRAQHEYPIPTNFDSADPSSPPTSA